MVEIIPYTDQYEAAALSLMMKCIREVKGRKFDPAYDEDMLDLASYYDPHDDSRLLLVKNKEQIIGTLGLKNEGILDERKTGMLKRLYVEKGFRGESWFPLMKTMAAHVRQCRFERIRFLTRARFGRTFELIQTVTARFGAHSTDVEDGKICTIETGSALARILRTLT